MSRFPQVSGHQSVCSFVYCSILICILCIIRIRCLSALNHGLVGLSDSIKLKLKLVKPPDLNEPVGSSSNLLNMSQNRVSTGNFYSVSRTPSPSSGSTSRRTSPNSTPPSSRDHMPQLISGLAACQKSIEELLQAV